jgi:mevalonate kinase
VIKERFFPAKLLLFGEHILLKGATALAVPASSFRGYWTKEASPSAELGGQLFRASVERLSEQLPLALDRILADMNSGWYFESNIPHGYGLGSSGAFCAGLLHRYGTRVYLDYSELKTDLAQLESSFHGKSSGIDPLTSYLNGPILIQPTSVELLDAVYQSPSTVSVFLLDTQQPRKTDHLVNWFLTAMESPVFLREVELTLMPIHEQMVAAWLAGDSLSFMAQLQMVSEWQWAHFKPMLPTGAGIQRLWQGGLNTRHTYLKICGAGGGGFVLGFTTDKTWVEGQANELQIPLFFPFDIPSNG